MNWTTPKSMDFEGRSVRYGVSGDGPPLVVVHGTPWSSYNMRHLIRGLSREFTVYYYDLLGYGESDKRDGDISLGVQNRVLAALLDHWHLESPDVVAHDFGGATALRTHLLNARPFRRLVLIDPVAVSPWGSAFFQHVRTHQEAFAGLPGFMHEAMVRRYIESAAHLPIAEDVLSRTVSPWTSDEANQAAFYRQIAQADSRYTDEVESRYGEISTPTLILWGEEDTWIPLERGRKLHGLIPGSDLRVIPDAGHLVIEERPDALLAEIRSFLGVANDESDRTSDRAAADTDAAAPTPIDLTAKLESFSEHWSPRVVAELNDYQFKVAKLQGEFVWHSHSETDEAFLVVAGSLRIEFRHRPPVELTEGELLVVPRGVEHRPVAESECHVLLVEPRGVVNTGDSGGDMYAENDVWI